MTENAHTPGPKTVPEVLNAAADLLEKPGAWMQEDYSNAGRWSAKGLQSATCWCIAGAIGAVADMDGPEAEEWANSVLGPLMGLEGSHPVTGVPGWNDAVGRTQTEVVDALREAAAKATGAPSHD